MEKSIIPQHPPGLGTVSRLDPAESEQVGRSFSMGSGYVKLHRSFLQWEWYSDPNCKAVMIHLLLTVNWVPGLWRGRVIEPGSVLTSTVQLSKDLGLSRSAVVRTLAKLQKSGEADTKSDNKWTLITLRNWDKYQKDVEEPDNKRTIKRTANRTQYKKEEAKKEEIMDPAFEALWLTFERYGSKAKALAYWNRLSPDDREAISAKAPAYVASTPGCKYRKQLEGWINPEDRRWERPIVDPAPTNGKSEETVDGIPASVFENFRIEFQAREGRYPNSGDQLPKGYKKWQGWI